MRADGPAIRQAMWVEEPDHRHRRLLRARRERQRAAPPRTVMKSRRLTWLPRSAVTTKGCQRRAARTPPIALPNCPNSALRGILPRAAVRGTYHASPGEGTSTGHVGQRFLASGDVRFG